MGKKQSSVLKTSNSKAEKKKGVLKVGFSIDEDSLDVEVAANANQLMRIKSANNISVKPAF